MAHEIDLTTGRAAVFVTREPAWHKLGTVVTEAQTAEKALQLAGQNWAVVQKAIFWKDWQGRECVIDTHKANVRGDTNAVLGIVGEGYVPFQNKEAFSFFDSVVGEGQAVYESAGALFEGRKVWIQARLPKMLRAAGDDVVNPYILLSNSHDGTQALRMYPTAVRVVCSNTLNRADRARKGVAAQGIAIRHCGDLKAKVSEAQRILGIAVNVMDHHQEEITALVGRKLGVQESLTYFKRFFPTTVKPPVPEGAQVLEAILDQQGEAELVVKDLLDAHYAETERIAKANTEILFQILGNYENERNKLPGIEHTAWAAYNAVSEHADHQMKYRGGSADRHLESIWWGRANSLKQEAFTSALALTV
jgi:phage/plasmid-like protein (TIGR03299 family)